MLAIRMQRTGRKGHAQFRMIVQDSRFNPSSGRVVAFLGSYNPHAKTVILDKEKANKYLANGAQPTDRVVKIFKSEGVKLPDWVSVSSPGKRTVKNPEKLRRNRPASAETPKESTEDIVADKPAEAVATEEKATPNESTEAVASDNTSAETTDTEPSEKTKAEETPAKETEEVKESAEDQPAD